MASPQDVAAGVVVGEPVATHTASWRTWHSDSDLALRRSLIKSMYVPLSSARDERLRRCKRMVADQSHKVAVRARVPA